MRHWSMSALLAAALICGCGSDGGGSTSGTEIQEKVLYTNLGQVRGDQPTVMQLNVAKPFYQEGTVELAAPPSGPFAPVEGTLPANLEGGHESTMWLTFTPPVGLAAAQEGTIRLAYRRVGSSSVYPVTLQLRAEVESPSVQILATQVSAGNVILGKTGNFGVYIENTSKVTPITVTDVTPPGGAFSLAPDAFPMPAPVGPGARFLVRLQFSPQNLGVSSSSIQVFHSLSAFPLEATLTGTGVEQPTARLVETEVSAGKAVVGEKLAFGVDFENTSAETPVTVTDVTVPDGEFSLDTGAIALPVTVAAGETLHIPLVFAPAGEWDASAVVQVQHSADTVPLEATVTGTGIPPRLYYDTVVYLDSWYESDWINVDVPPEAVGLYIEVTGDPWSSLIDLVEMKGPNDTVYESYWSGPLNWASYYPAGGYGYLNIELPNSDSPDVQLVPGGGTYSFRVADSWWGTSTLNVRVTIVQRTADPVQEGTLNLRVFLADGLGLYFDPMSDFKLAQVIRTIDSILGEQGVRLGNVSFTVMSPDYDYLWDSWYAEQMFITNTAGYPEDALNLFFVYDMSWWGIAGIAGAAPGPATNGTAFSGVAMDFNAADGITLGAIAAHEIGHYLGHFDGGPDGIYLTSDEAYPVLRHPLLNPGLPETFFATPENTDPSVIQAIIDQMPAMDAWCGTCTRWPAR